MTERTRLAAAAVPVRRVVALVLVAAFGLYVAQLTLNTALSLRLATVDPDGKELSYGMAVALGGLLLIPVVPLAGALSDRTRSRFGRRRPWLLGGLLPCLAGCVLIGVVPSVPVIVAGYLVAFTCLNAAFIAFTAIPAEGVPSAMHARVMGLMGLFGALSMAAGNYLYAALVHVQVLMMAAPALLALVCSLPLLVAYRDPVIAEAPPLRLRRLARGFAVDPRRHPDFGWAWLSRFLAGMAMAGMLSYFTYFLMDGLGMGVAETGAKAGLLSLASAPVSIAAFTLSGWASDRARRRKPFVAASAVVMGLALLVAAAANSFGTFLLAWLLFAAGQGVYLTVDLALCAAALPDSRDTGKDMGVFSLALSIPNILVPALAPVVLDLGGPANYPLLFGLCAVLGLLGAVAVRPVRGVR